LRQLHGRVSVLGKRPALCARWTHASLHGNRGGCGGDVAKTNRPAVETVCRHAAGAEERSSMYPDGDLNQLALHKLSVRRRIGFHRDECVEAAERIAQPLEKIDAAIAQWRRISPLAKVAAVPIAMMFRR